MSIQTCEQFLRAVSRDAALQQEVATALDGIDIEKNPSAAANTLVAVGAQHGYEFTTTAAMTYYPKMIAQAEGELDDEALEQVAGGAGSPPVAVSAAIAAMAGIHEVGIAADDRIDDLSGGGLDRIGDGSYLN